MKNILTIIALVLAFTKGITQDYNPIGQDPVSPTAFEFLKYGEIPVSDYTGIPNISIPIYNIQEKGISLPINLTYHANGIRVNQEASEVGLGWNLQHGGSIVQIINDEDDYGVVFGGEIEKILPDYWESPIASIFPYRYNYPIVGMDGPDWRSPIDIIDPIHRHSYKIATDNFIPVKGRFDQQHSFLSQPNYDSEHDIFKANFLGHSLEFIREFDANGHLKIFNKKGYKLERTAINGSDFNWKITAPDGNQFYFDVVIKTISVGSFSDGDITSSTGNGGSNKPTTKTWLLTKIITIQNQEINFNYEQNQDFDFNFINYSQRFQHLTENWYTTNLNNALLYRYYDGKNIVRRDGVLNSHSSSKEKYTYIKSIDFSKGSIIFEYSSRIDIQGSKKIDRIEIRNINNKPIDVFDFNYDYFQAISNDNEYQSNLNNLDVLTSEKNNRLKLNSVVKNGDQNYRFKYNANQLPSKTSFAQDYWGFYNGQLSNTSLIPNPARFNFQHYNVDNGNNHSANLEYAKAGILQEIIYPTGGRTKFEYTLNYFDDYSVPSFSGRFTQGSLGLGLKIKSITNYDDNNFVNKKIYSYSGGHATRSKLINFRHTAILMEENYSVNTVFYSAARSYTVDVIDGNGYYTSSPLGSINGVGYSNVTITDTDAMGNAKGKIIKRFTNANYIEAPKSGDIQEYLQLPSRRTPNTPENGNLLSEEIYNAKNDTLKTVNYRYTNQKSKLYYSTKIRAINNLYYANFNVNQGSPFHSVPQHLIGYYPINTMKTRLSGKDVKTYYENGNEPLLEKYSYGYDTYDQVILEKYYSDFPKEKIETKYNYLRFLDKNIFNLPRNINKTRYTEASNIGKLFSNQYLDFKEYPEHDNAVLLKEIWNCSRGANPPNVIDSCINTSINKYDDRGNVLEHQTDQGVLTAIIWGYDNTLPIAKFENIAYDDIPISTINNLKSLSNLDSDNCSLGSCKEQDLRDALDNLRTTFPLAMITSYTYDPLIGVTSITSPNNVCNYYQYDDQNRLQYAVDTDGNLVGKNEYKYRTNN